MANSTVVDNCTRGTIPSPQGLLDPIKTVSAPFFSTIHVVGQTTVVHRPNVSKNEHRVVPCMWHWLRFCLYPPFSLSPLSPARVQFLLTSRFRQ